MPTKGLNIENLASAPTLDLGLDEPELQKQVTLLKRKKTLYEKQKYEELKRISPNCIVDASFGDSGQKMMNELSKKIILVSFTAILTYYGIYQLGFLLLQNTLTAEFYSFMMFTLIAFFSIFVLSSIIKKDFGKTQLGLFIIIYSGFSFLGVVFTMIKSLPITSYQLINSFVIILFVQVIIFILITPMTRKLVCRSSDVIQI